MNITVRAVMVINLITFYCRKWCLQYYLLEAIDLIWIGRKKINVAVILYTKANGGLCLLILALYNVHNTKQQVAKEDEQSIYPSLKQKLIVLKI